MDQVQLLDDQDLPLGEKIHVFESFYLGKKKEKKKIIKKLKKLKKKKKRLISQTKKIYSFQKKNEEIKQKNNL
jgi:hypothetical protein